MEFELKIAFLFLFFGFVLSQQKVPLSLNSERLALLELRYSLGVRAKDWPKKAEPCFNWKGIQCQGGRVREMKLSSFRRTNIGRRNPRFAVDSLSNLTLLSSFNSSGFSLPGPIPEWFGQRLVALQVLDLSSSSIFGSIPVSLGLLAKLKLLNLSGNLITGVIPASLGDLYSLSILDFSRNLITGSIPNAISSLGNLTSLDLSSNSLEGAIPFELGSLLSLRFLRLQNNSLSNSIPSQLSNLSKLVELDLGYNFFSGPLPASLFLNLNQLTNVVLSRNEFDGQFPDVLLSKPQMRFLDVSGNKFTGFLPNLTAFLKDKDAGVFFNFSGNLFYGNLSDGVEGISSFDLSSNYFGGMAPTDGENSTIFSNNCFLNVPDQRRVEDCRSFYAKKGLVYDRNEAPDTTTPSSSVPSKDRRKIKYIIGGTFGGVGLILILALGLLLMRKLCAKRTVNHGGTEDVKPVSLEDGEPNPMASPKPSGLGEAFAYEQILLATSYFDESNLFRHGHSGDLFYGTLNDGKLVVIKRINVESAKKETYNSELDLFSKVTHPRFVPLLGHCLEHENEIILVYKNMSNGDLSNSLHKFNHLEGDTLESLDWITRLKIAIGAAEGLCYLHHECDPPLVHRDIQASSILLDDKYEVRLGSLSEICVQGGDDNLHKIKRLVRMPQESCAYDVYCFGKVLLELVTGKLGISSSDEASTNEWLEKNLSYISIQDKESIAKIVDQSLVVDEDLLEEVWAMAIVAKSCLNPKPSKRPPIRHILTALENPFKVVRDETFSSERLRTTSSRRSWTAAFFNSWRLSSSSESNNNVPKQSARTVSHGRSSSSANEYSFSHKRSSSEIFPEPLDVRDAERQEEN